MERIAFCENCFKDVEFEIRNELVKVDLDDIAFTYGAHVPFCKECGNELSVPEINDLNIIKAYKAQKEALENRESSY
ncbi:MAG: hypothetical protein BWY74_02371 [Firmicutes bacterium ADurb.Bin419]|nr:MAG: hypothetical protein BWY74_02371 [Firmicutes bacterium ADurb.Bin419]